MARVPSGAACALPLCTDVSSFGMLDGLSLGVGGTVLVLLFELGATLLISYVLFWSVTTAGADYRLAATGVYLVLALVNLLYAISCLWGVVELLHFLVYSLKAAAALLCALYAVRIREAAQVDGATLRVCADNQDGSDALPEPRKLPAPQAASEAQVELL